MRIDAALRWSWMNVLTAKRAAKLLEHHESLEAALASINLEMLRGLGCKEETAILALERLESFDIVAYAEELASRGIALITDDDDAYPPLLKEIADRPLFLYARGDLSIMQQPCLSMVGTREMSDYGRRVVGAFVPGIVRAGMVTVSGLAYGIDAEVAKETLHTGGKTIAVLGHGMGMIYPKANQKLADAIVAGGGLLLSEFPLDTAPDKYTFPARNRIIAGLGLGTIVLEAASGSGSLITADLALDYNRDVFAVPGHIFDEHYQGCHQLIARGTASLALSPDDVLRTIGIVGSAKESDTPPFSPSSQDEAIVFDALTSMPQPIDDLSEKTGKPAATLGAILTMLELSGGAKNIGGGKWVRG